MKKSRHLILKIALYVLLVGTSFGALWLGLVPQRYSPFAPVDLSEPNSWFLDMRLAAMKNDKSACETVLQSPLVKATAIPDQPFREGCGWKNAISLSSAGNARLSTERITCEMAAGLAMWLEHEVKPAARKYFSADIKSVQHMGTYACRNIAGSKFWKDFRSQHATASAIDIASFTLSDGRTISVVKDWKGDMPESRFLHEVHKRACRYFRVSIGPNFNAAHANHFHYDRGPLKACR